MFLPSTGGRIVGAESRYVLYTEMEELSCFSFLSVYFTFLIIIHAFLLCQESWSPSRRIREEWKNKPGFIRLLQQCTGSGIIQEYLYVQILFWLIFSPVYFVENSGFAEIEIYHFLSLGIFYVSLGVLGSTIIRRPFFTPLNSSLAAAGTINLLGLICAILSIGEFPFSLFAISADSSSILTTAFCSIVVFLLACLNHFRLLRQTEA